MDMLGRENVSTVGVEAFRPGDRFSLYETLGKLANVSMGRPASAALRRSACIVRPFRGRRAGHLRGVVCARTPRADRLVAARRHLQPRAQLDGRRLCAPVAAVVGPGDTGRCADEPAWQRGWHQPPGDRDARRAARGQCQADCRHTAGAMARRAREVSRTIGGQVRSRPDAALPGPTVAAASRNGRSVCADPHERDRVDHLANSGDLDSTPIRHDHIPLDFSPMLLRTAAAP